MEIIMFFKKAKTFLLACLLAFAMCSTFTAKTFGQEPDEKDRARMIHPDIMGKNAKYTRQSYSRDIKQAEANQVFERYGSEIETVVTWLEPVIRELGLMAFLEKHAGLRQ